MSAEITRNRRYVIENDWLALYGDGGDEEDRGAYVDVQEIKNNPSASVYLQQVGALRGFTGATLTTYYEDESVKANFLPTGFHVGDTDDGQHVRGNLRNETSPYELKYQTGEYDQSFRRVYAVGTTARNLAFLGFEA